MKRLASLAFFAFCTFFAMSAFAHKPSDSYLTLTVQGGHVTGRWDIALRDLSFVMDLDADGDGKITWSELSAHQAEIETYALGRLAIDGCKLHIAPKRSIAAHSDGTYTVLELEGDCEAAPSSLAITYRLFFDVDAQHRGLLRLESGTSRTHVFSAKEPRATFDLRESGAGRQFRTILKEGIFHIWTGYDHILFLIALLLPAVQRDSLKKALLDVLRIVTAFTVAHSITLSLAALGIVTLPSRLIESAIAASVVLAALNNLRPILREDRWVAAFLLGLMHGFGFSAALMDLDLPRSNLVATLFGFNLGVEIGQIAVVAVFVPLAFRMRATIFYQRIVLRGGSVIILILASIWLIERAANVKILP
jgi:hydrogenase/urease accessory protein HupE